MDMKQVNEALKKELPSMKEQFDKLMNEPIKGLEELFKGK